MRFRRVDSEVMSAAVATLPRPRTEGRARLGQVAADPPGHVDAVLRFVQAYRAGDVEALGGVCQPGITCRWVGFDGAAERASGMSDVLALGREFERRYGQSDRTTVVESMTGQDHVAILFRVTDQAPGVPAARVAVYRLQQGRVAAIAVYADLPD